MFRKNCLPLDSTKLGCGGWEIHFLRLEQLNANHILRKFHAIRVYTRDCNLNKWFF